MRNQSRILLVLMLALIATGAVIRIRQYLANRSLWLDESLLALNIVERPYASALQPLDYSQAAPPGFFLFEKGLMETLGNRDYVLRMLPLGASLAALVFMAWIAWMYLRGAGRWIAVALVVVSDRLIYYSSELKQYSSDTAIGLGLVALAGLFFKPPGKRGHWAGLALAGALAVWFSHPAVFILAAIGLSLGLSYLVRKDGRSLLAVSAVAAVWAASFGLFYLLSLRYASASEFLSSYWSAYFMPLPPWQNLAWFTKTFQTFLRSIAGFEILPLAVGLFLVGSVSLFWRRWDRAVLLLSPVLFVLVAAAFKKYPFGDRLVLFLVPLVYAVVAEGADQTGRLLGRFFRRPAWLRAVLAIAVAFPLLIAPARSAVNTLRYPRMFEENKAMLLRIQQNLQPGDAIYVYYSAAPAFIYYAPRYHLEDQPAFIGTSWRQDPQRYIDELSDLPDCARLWVLFSHIHAGPPNEETLILAAVDQLGERIDEYRVSGGALYLYSCGKAARQDGQAKP